MICAWGANREGQTGECCNNDNEKTEPRCVSAIFHSVIGHCVAIRQVAAGQAHSLILTEFGDVFSCGRHREGQLGHGQSTLVGSTGHLRLVGGLRPWCIAKIGAGDRHSFALTDTGLAFEWGLLLPVAGSEDNSTSRWAERRQGLGVEMDDDTEDFKRRIVASSYLEYMRNGLSECDAGDLDDEMLMRIVEGGEHFRIPVHEPRICIGLEGKVINKVACGYAHTVVANSDGSLFASGYNEKGQLGNGSRFHSVSFNLVSTPMPLAGSGMEIGQLVASSLDFALSCCTLACGHNHTAAILQGGQVVTWGFGTFGQLGLGKEKKESCFPKVVDVQGVAVEVACGDNHSLLLLEDGKLLVFGHRDALGPGTNQTRLPRQLSDFGDKGIKRIFAGGMASFALTDGSAADALDLHSWGYNQRQHLGRGLWVEQLRPQPVMFPQDLYCGKDLSDFCSGSGHCMAAIHLPKDQIALPAKASEPHTRNPRLLAMLRDTSSHDVHLKTEEGKVQGAHRLVLRLRCPALLSRMTESSEGVFEICLLQHSADCVRAFLEYLYCDFCRVSHKTAAELQPLAHSLGLVRLAVALGAASHSGGNRNDGESRYVRTAVGRWVKVEVSQAEENTSFSVHPSTYATDLERLVVSVCAVPNTSNCSGANVETDFVTLKVRSHASEADEAMEGNHCFRVARALLQTVDVFQALLNFPGTSDGPDTTVDVVADDVVAFSCLLRFLATGDRDVIPAETRSALAVIIEAHHRGLEDVLGVAEHRLLEGLKKPGARSGDLSDLVPLAKLYSLDRILTMAGPVRV
eukprot:gnl/MRDRNA2_/MRDRNA2_99013_c0_seq1.p1 gnl/MRDRNA2_/MRDRNA2_99013_c0~~gnl/MRDRNA2_/MRDRNA2_99013_c0_seq1.p1  ORF type:complete len:801 (+),score=127.10 gnl/MRDRNA2_/MRDRNA2_99013_c0_seq1:116-2518(+)